MNLFVLPETSAAASTLPAARGRAPKAPTDDFVLMLAESTAALRPEKPAPAKDAPRESEPVEQVDATPASEADRAPAKPDAPPEVDDDSDGEDAAEAATNAVAAAASAAANVAATVAADVVESAAGEGAALTAGVDTSATPPLPSGEIVMASLGADAFATETALEQAALPQNAGSAAPAKPAATPATAPVSADTPAVDLSGSLLATAPEPAVPGNATDAAAAATQSTPGLTTAPRTDAKPSLLTQINVQSPAPSPTPASQQPPASLALAPPAQETAAPGAGMIQAAIAATVRDAAPDSPAPSASPAAADTPAAVPPAGPGHSPTAPAEHAASLPPAAAPTAPTLDNIAQYAVRSVRLMVQDGQKTLTVRLIPPSLGELHLEVSSVHDSLYVRLMSSNPVVRDALESQLNSLRDTLARSGVDAASVTVSSGSTTGQASQNLFGGRQDAGAARFDPQSSPSQNPAAGQETSRRSTGHQGLIDVFV